MVIQKTDFTAEDEESAEKKQHNNYLIDQARAQFSF
jgi:hypothetical protein